MSIPALRQPKNITKTPPTQLKFDKSAKTAITAPQNFLIISLANGKKLVVSSDAYHGILTASELYRCIFCETVMVLDAVCKERHVQSENHRKILQHYPHAEEFEENLIRKLNGGHHYCTLCNVVIPSNVLHKHLDTEVHQDKLHQATTKAGVYQPHNNKEQEWPALK